MPVDIRIDSLSKIDSLSNGSSTAYKGRCQVNDFASSTKGTSGRAQVKLYGKIGLSNAAVDSVDIDIDVKGSLYITSVKEVKLNIADIKKRHYVLSGTMPPQEGSDPEKTDIFTGSSDEGSAYIIFNKEHKAIKRIWIVDFGISEKTK